MEIGLNTILLKGKYKGKTINDIEAIGDKRYIYWIINNWKDTFLEDVKLKHGYNAHIMKEYPFNCPGITLESGWENLS